jgi:hypothetical protein
MRTNVEVFSGAVHSSQELGTEQEGSLFPVGSTVHRLRSDDMRVRRAIGVSLFAAVLCAGVLAVLWSRAARDQYKAAMDEETAVSRERTNDTPVSCGDDCPVSADRSVATRIVSGVLRDEAQAPVGNAEVMLLRRDPDGRVHAGLPVMDAGSPVVSGRSGADGRYELRLHEAGTLAVLARKDGYVPGTAFVNTEGPTDIILERASEREFRVRDSADRPIAGAELSVYCVGDFAPARITRATNESGVTVLPIAPQSRVVIRAAGYVSEDIWVKPLKHPQVITLHEARRLGGVVVNGDGLPLQGVLVTLSGPAPQWEDCQQTRADGHFEFDGAESQGYLTSGWRLSARMQGWVARDCDVFPGDERLHIVMRRAGTVRGIVVDEDGQPLEGANIMDLTRTSPDGRFEADGLWPGRQKVWAACASPVDPRASLFGTTYVDVPEGGLADGVMVTVKAPVSESYVCARVLPADSGLASGAVVRAWVNGTVIGQQETDDAGAALVTVDGPPGTLVDLTASRDEDRRLGLPSFDGRVEKMVRTAGAPPFEPVELQLTKLRRIRIRLIDPNEQEIPFQTEFVTGSAVGADGTAVVRVAKDFEATIRVPGYAITRLTLKPPHDEFREATVRLVRAVGLTGCVLDHDGNPIAGNVLAYAEALGPGNERRLSERVRCDASGHFSVDTLPPGPTRLTVRKDDDLVLEKSFEIPNDRLLDLGVVRCGEPFTFHGLVVDPSGAGLGGARVIGCDRFGAEVVPPVCTRKV